MKIEMDVSTNDEHGQYTPGQVIDLHEAEALNYIKKGWAHPYKGKVVERAVVDAKEHAVAPAHPKVAHSDYVAGADVKVYAKADTVKKTEEDEAKENVDKADAKADATKPDYKPDPKSSEGQHRAGSANVPAAEGDKPRAHPKDK